MKGYICWGIWLCQRISWSRNENSAFIDRSSFSLLFPRSFWTSLATNELSQHEPGENGIIQNYQKVNQYSRAHHTQYNTTSATSKCKTSTTPEDNATDLPAIPQPSTATIADYLNGFPTNKFTFIFIYITIVFIFLFSEPLPLFHGKFNINICRVGG